MEHNRAKFLGEHFKYEVEMLIHSVQKLIDANQGGDTNDVNMGLESFLLHSRNLTEFFYFPKDRKKECARAVDFISQDEWNRVRPQRDEEIKSFLKRANHETSHLTYKRFYGDPDDKRWKWGQYFLKLIKVIRSFLDNLPEKYIGAQLEQLSEAVRHITESSSEEVK